MIAKIGRTLPNLLAFSALLSVASTALGQGNTFNPYGNSGYADYREFGSPMVSNNPALPGQAILNAQPSITRQRANAFQQYSNEIDGIDGDASSYRRAASANVPYYQAYQRLNSQYNRVYQANNTDEDRAFYDRQKQRDLAFAKALKETDPAKRAKLLRQVEQDSIDRPAAGPRTSTAKGATPARAGAAGATPAPRPSAPVERRQPAPSPYASDAVRRPSTPAPSPRVPASGRSTTTPPSSRPPAVTRPAPDPSTIAAPPGT